MKTSDAQHYKWKDEYSVNISVIDEQHQKFLEILNFLKNVVLNNECQKKLHEIFFSLAHFIEHHLINEEIYFKEYKYPEFNEHKEQHKEFIERVVKFQEDSENGKEKVCVGLLHYLEDWFNNHILEENIKAMKYLIEQGAK